MKKVQRFAIDNLNEEQQRLDISLEDLTSNLNEYCDTQTKDTARLISNKQLDT